MTIVVVFLRTRWSSRNRHPTHGTTIAAPSHSIVSSGRPIARRMVDTRDGGLSSGSFSAAPVTRTAGCTTAADTGSAREAADRFDALVASGASDAARRSAFVSRTNDLGTHACQPARMRLYCDLGTDLDEAFLIWNQAS